MEWPNEDNSWTEENSVVALVLQAYMYKPQELTGWSRNYTPGQNWASFVRYLKIIRTFWQ